MATLKTTSKLPIRVWVKIFLCICNHKNASGGIRVLEPVIKLPVSMKEVLHPLLEVAYLRPYNAQLNLTPELFYGMSLATRNRTDVGIFFFCLIYL